MYSLDSDVDEDRHPVGVHDDVADVVVVVALRVVPAPGRDVEPPRRAGLLAGGHHLQVGEPHLAVERLGRGRRREVRRPQERGQDAGEAAVARHVVRAVRPAASSQEGTEAGERRVPHRPAVSEDELRLRPHLRRRIADVHVVLPRDVGPGDVLADRADDRLAVDVEAAPARRVQQLERLEERGPRASPVARPLVAAAVVRVGVDESIEAPGDLPHRAHAALRVALQQQDARQPVRVDPGVPVVDLARGEAHPPEVVALEVRGEDAPAHLEAQALAHEGVDGVEAFAHQVVGPGEECARLRREEIDRGLGDVGEARSPLLGADVRGHAPVALLADEPKAVRDRVREPAPVLEELAQDEKGELPAPREEQPLVPPAVPVAHVVQEPRGREDRPLGGKLPLRLGDERLPLGLRDHGPACAVGDRRIRPEGARPWPGPAAGRSPRPAFRAAAGARGCRAPPRGRGKGRRGGRARGVGGALWMAGAGFDRGLGVSHRAYPIRLIDPCETRGIASAGMDPTSLTRTQQAALVLLRTLILKGEIEA